MIAIQVIYLMEQSSTTPASIYGFWLFAEHLKNRRFGWFFLLFFKKKKMGVRNRRCWPMWLGKASWKLWLVWWVFQLLISVGWYHVPGFILSILPESFQFITTVLNLRNRSCHSPCSTDEETEAWSHLRTLPKVSISKWWSWDLNLGWLSSECLGSVGRTRTRHV